MVLKQVVCLSILVEFVQQCTVRRPSLYTFGSIESLFIHADDEDVCEGDMDKVDSTVNSITMKSNTVGQSAATSQGD